MQWLKLSYNSWSSELLNELNTMRLTDDMCDVRIILQENVVLSAHSNVLAAASPLFKSILAGTVNPEINMQDFPMEIVQSVIDFIYTGSTRISRGDLLMLHSVSTSLNIPVLTDMTQKLLQHSLPQVKSVGKEHKSSKIWLSPNVDQLSDENEGQETSAKLSNDEGRQTVESDQVTDEQAIDESADVKSRIAEQIACQSAEPLNLKTKRVNDQSENDTSDCVSSLANQVPIDIRPDGDATYDEPHHIVKTERRDDAESSWSEHHQMEVEGQGQASAECSENIGEQCDDPEHSYAAEDSSDPDKVT